MDSCLTTGEVQELLEKYGFKNLADIPGGRSDGLMQQLQQSHLQKQQQHQQQDVNMPEARLPEPMMHPQIGSSGGYAQHVFKAAARHLFGVDLSTLSSDGTQPGQLGHLPFKVLRNADLQELQLLGPSGEPLLRFGIAYGFRNIQTLVRKIKSGRCEYDYVELMACPSGCLNGGGQIKAAAGVSAAQHIEQLELLGFRQQALEQQQQQQTQNLGVTVSPGVIQLVQKQQNGTVEGSASTRPDIMAAAAGVGLVNGHSSSRDWSWAAPDSIQADALSAVYDVLLRGQPGTAAVGQLLHTHYHRREKTVTSTLADW